MFFYLLSCDNISSPSFTALSHNFHYTYGCYESGGVRVDVLLDDDVGGYADFSKGEVVWAMPHPSQYVKNFTKHAYEIAQAANAHCHSVLSKAKKADPDAPMRQGTGRDFIREPITLTVQFLFHNVCCLFHHQNLRAPSSTLGMRARTACLTLSSAWPIISTPQPSTSLGQKTGWRSQRGCQTCVTTTTVTGRSTEFQL